MVSTNPMKQINIYALSHSHLLSILDKKGEHLRINFKIMFCVLMTVCKKHTQDTKELDNLK